MSMQNDDGIVLMTSMAAVQFENPERRREIRRATEINCDNPAITEVVIFFEGGRLPDVTIFQHPKIRIKWVDARPRYGCFFDDAKANYPGRAVAVTSADIAFFPDSNIEQAHGIGDDELWFIGRYDFNPAEQRWMLHKHFPALNSGGGTPAAPLEDNILRTYPEGTHPADYVPVAKEAVDLNMGYAAGEYLGTADGFIFRSPLPSRLYTRRIGMPGCDLYLMVAAYMAGIRLLFPSLSIIGRHFHSASWRHYPPARGFFDRLIEPAERQIWFRYMRDKVQLCRLDERTYCVLKCRLPIRILIYLRALFSGHAMPVKALISSTLKIRKPKVRGGGGGGV